MKNLDRFKVYCDCCNVESICCEIRLLCETFQICKECLEKTLHEGFPENVLQNHLDYATKLVESWPAWKQNILGNSSKPNVEVPRIPIVKEPIE